MAFARIQRSNGVSNVMPITYADAETSVGSSRGPGTRGMRLATVTVHRLLARFAGQVGCLGAALTRLRGCGAVPCSSSGDV
jgi:hypothetical protein